MVLPFSAGFETGPISFHPPMKIAWGGQAGTRYGILYDAQPWEPGRVDVKSDFRRRPLSLTAFEGVVENGRIRLDEDVRLPEQTRVVVVVPETPVSAPTAHIASPRLASPEDAQDFVLEVVELSDDPV